MIDPKCGSNPRSLTPSTGGGHHRPRRSRLHPALCGRAIEVESVFIAPSSSRPRCSIPIFRSCARRWKRIRALRHASGADDAGRGYTGKHRAVASCGGASASAATRGVFAPASLHRRAGTSRLGVFILAGVMVGRAKRALIACFVMTLSWSRALYLEFFSSIKAMENFLRGQCLNAFGLFRHGKDSALRQLEVCGAGAAREADPFNPRLWSWQHTINFEPRPCQVAGRQSKGSL